MRRPHLRLPSFVRGLSARLLLLTVLFVMVAEVLIYAPSIARFRLTYLEDRLAEGLLSTVALRTMGDDSLRDDLRHELLGMTDSYLIGVTWPGATEFMIAEEMPPPPDLYANVNDGSFLSLIFDAFDTLLQTENRVIEVTGYAPKDPRALVFIRIDEAPLRDAMVDFSERILALSLIISFVTATLVYLALQWLTVRPIRKMTENMVRFGINPEDPGRVIKPSRRNDEIGVAQRGLAEMEEGLRASLRQKNALAALGTAVAKINHDLRNILSTALLVSDRLSHSGDAEARRQAPTIVNALERAIELCRSVLNFARHDVPEPSFGAFPLRGLVGEVADEATTLHIDCTIANEVQAGLEVTADRELLHRAFDNLIRNACEAGAKTVTVRADEDESGATAIEIEDDGPGIPTKVAESLFVPFVSTSKSSGSGLGLAIARELVRAHGGDLALIATSSSGTTFRITLPRAELANAA